MLVPIYMASPNSEAIKILNSDLIKYTPMRCMFSGLHKICPRAHIEAMEN